MGSVRSDRNAQIVLSIDDLTICVLDSTRTGHAIPLDLHADQLPPILAACRRILDEYPVVGVA